MVLAAAIFLLGARVSWAHDHAPDPQMLLDLDLFTPGSGDDSQGTQNSMLDQIRTLQAMGYLSGANQPAPQPVYSSPPPPPEDSEDQVVE
jgi:hypothetical protein